MRSEPIASGAWLPTKVHRQDSSDLAGFLRADMSDDQAHRYIRRFVIDAIAA